jgi:NitT/TauT family transport system substrate-binding protein
MCLSCGLDIVHAGDSSRKPLVSRRQTLDMLAAGGLAALGTWLGGFGSAAHAADDEVVRIGYLPITDATALLVAHGKGFFADEGLIAERPTLIRGWSPLVEAFAAGKFNLVHLLKPIPVWMRYNNNFPVKIMAWAHTNGSGVVVGKDAGIKSFADLGGKQVAVPFWYSMHNIVLQYALRKSRRWRRTNATFRSWPRRTCRPGSPPARSTVTSWPSRSMRSARSRQADACCALPGTSGRTTLAACCACTRTL